MKIVKGLEIRARQHDMIYVYMFAGSKERWYKNILIIWSKPDCYVEFIRGSHYTPRYEKYI